MIHHEDRTAFGAAYSHPRFSPDDTAGPRDADAFASLQRDDPRYRGWSNYTTWRVNVELVSDLVDELVEDVHDGTMQPFDATDDLADYLEDEVGQILSGYGELTAHPTAALALSYAHAYMQEVDFWEIAERAVQNHPELLVPADDEPA